MTVPANASEKERRSEVDSLLDRLLECGSASLHVQERKHLGSIVHIFSHIRMTLHVERLVVKACILVPHNLIGTTYQCSLLLGCRACLSQLIGHR